MIKTVISLASAILVVEIIAASAGSYPDSFADYLNARGLYLDYLSAAEGSFWVKTSAGDIVLRMPSAVVPKVSVVSAEEPPSDTEVASIRSDLELAMSSALGRLGVHRCSSDAADDPASCIPFALQIGFSARHGDVVYMPNLRDSSGRQIAGLATEYFGSHDKLYGIGCRTNAEISAAGEVAHLDAAFTFEIAPSGAQTSDVPPSPAIDLGALEMSTPQQVKPLTAGMEECILSLLGVSIVRES